MTSPPEGMPTRKVIIRVALELELLVPAMMTDDTVKANMMREIHIPLTFAGQLRGIAIDVATAHIITPDQIPFPRS